MREESKVGDMTYSHANDVIFDSIKGAVSPPNDDQIWLLGFNVHRIANVINFEMENIRNEIMTLI